MSNNRSPLNARNIKNKIYQYNNDMINNNYIIKDRNDLSQEKTKPIRRSIKIKQTKINFIIMKKNIFIIIIYIKNGNK